MAISFFPRKAIFRSVFVLLFATQLLAARVALGQNVYSALGVRSMALNSHWMKMEGGFGAEFFLTDVSPSVRLLPEDLLTANHLFQTKRTKPLHVALFIVDPRGQHILDSHGLQTVEANVNYDIMITRPDGSIYFEYKGAPGWSGSMPSPHLVHLTQSTVNLTFEAIDSPGLYTVAILVHDKIAKIDIPLRHSITLEP